MADNQGMSLSSRARGVLAVLAALSLNGCGYAEWPPRYSRPADVNRPVRAQAETPKAPQTAALAFRNASAVIVGEGDTVYALSRRHGVSTRAIIEANTLKPPFHLIVGQRIVLLRYPEHRVASGDTLIKIAQTYDVGMHETARLNDLEPPYTIFVGQRLRLPRAGALETARAAARPKPVTKAAAPAKSTPPPRAKASSPASPPLRTVAAAPRPAKAARPAASRAIPKPPPASGRGFRWPIQGRVLSNFGAKGKGFHNDGINIAAPRGTPIQAAEHGVVVYAGNELRGFGNLLLIKHAGGWVTAYAHADKLLVARGDKVRKGQKVATVGTTGSVTRPQLHFEIRKGKRAREPRKHLRRA